jgi:cytochrome c biogenesis protein CcmG/thiol:disulfide interchange protein DsbE
VACTGPGSAAPQWINVGNRARDFTLSSLDGSEVSLSDYRGDVVLVNFWATWCAPCRAEIPALEAAYQARKDDGLVVLGVNIQESSQVIEPFAEEFAMSYPVLLDEQSRVMEAYRGLGLPMSILVDRDGVIQVRHVGILTAAQLESHLAKHLP